MNKTMTASSRSALAHTVAGTMSRVHRWLEALQPAALLAARLYVARVFFLSGLTKALRREEPKVATSLAGSRRNLTPTAPPFQTSLDRKAWT